MIYMLFTIELVFFFIHLKNEKINTPFDKYITFYS